MSKQTAIIITIVATAVAVIGLISWYLFLSPKATVNSEGITSYIVSSFFPQSSNTKPITDRSLVGETSTSTETGDPNEPAPKVRKITGTPVAGFTIIVDKKEGQVVRYMESATGHTWSAPLSVMGKSRLTNTTIPKVREALWLSNGTRVIARYLDDVGRGIVSFKASVTQKKSDVGTPLDGTLDGTFMPSDIVSMTGSPSGDKIFYLTENENGGSGVIVNADSGKSSLIFSSPIKEWLPQWANNTLIYLTTKPSAFFPGYLYSVNTASGAQTRVLGGIPGLTTNANPQNTYIVYSDTTNNGFNLFSYNLKNKATEEMPLKTLAEKCAWDKTDANVIYCGIPKNPKNAAYPDEWYQGIVSFEDDLWKFNLKTGEVFIVTIFSEVTNEPIDIISPLVSPDSSYVVFLNKNDSSIWSVRVK